MLTFIRPLTDVAQIAEVIAGIKGIDVEEVVNVSCQNVYDLFGSLEKEQ